MFSSLSITINFLIFFLMAGCIWMAGTRLSYYIDAVAEKTKIARAFLGLILLATATELPEMVTTLTASSRGNGALAINNMFGGMMLQLAVLAIADLTIKKGTLSSFPRTPTVAVSGLLLIISLSFLLVTNYTGDIVLVAHIGLGSVIIALLYIGAMLLLRKLQSQDIWSPVDLPDKQEKDTRQNRFDSLSLRRLIVLSVCAAVVILVSGSVVVRVAETLAEQTGLGSSFVGVSLLAMTTSLPELSTSIAAVRVKAYTMAISNVFGSNLIMTFLIFPVDIFYTDGPVLNSIDRFAAFGLVAGIFLTAIYCLGLLTRPRKKILGMGIDSFVILIGYAASIFVLYHLK